MYLPLSVHLYNPYLSSSNTLFLSTSTPPLHPSVLDISGHFYYPSLSTSPTSLHSPLLPLWCTSTRPCLSTSPLLPHPSSYTPLSILYFPSPYSSGPLSIHFYSRPSSSTINLHLLLYPYTISPVRCCQSILISPHSPGPFYLSMMSGDHSSILPYWFLDTDSRVTEDLKHSPISMPSFIHQWLAIDQPFSLPHADFVICTGRVNLSYSHWLWYG